MPHEAASVRLFLGLWPTAEVRDAVQAHAQAWQWPASARRTRLERLHVTLHFIGAVPTARLDEVRQGLAVPFAGCELLLDRMAVWPGGIAVLEAGEVPRELVQLHAALAQKLRALQLPVEERRYRPHVTLARKAFGARPPPDAQPLRWSAPPGYLLVESLPGGRGYAPVQVYA
ncbi:MAG TPA: RNA 2',3'-cyclic phosphodiesterase [Ramlibacter sp.]|jgi:2'-5' RNA ligase|nr:RNA 2',3'-cyclic phosphodiesterase [Ramlibacter sp.]